MVETLIDLDQGLIRLGLIEDLNLATTVRRPLQWLERKVQLPGIEPRASVLLARLRSLIRPSVISSQSKLIGVPTIRLPAVIMLKIPLNQQSTHSYYPQTINSKLEQAT